LNKRRFLTAIIALVMVICGAAVLAANLLPGTKAPDFSLPTVDGKTFTLSDEFKKPGNVVVLDFWATHCEPCLKEIPYLVDIQDDYSKKNVQVVGVSLDRSTSKTKSKAEELKVNYPVPLDPGGAKLVSKYKVMRIPVTYIIDKKGIIRYVHSGFPLRDEAAQKRQIGEMRKQIDKLLAEK